MGTTAKSPPPASPLEPPPPTSSPDRNPDQPTPTGPAPGADTPAPVPDTEDAPTLALRTTRPTEGFDLTPPDGFHPVEYHPDHGRSWHSDDRHGGVRFYHRRGTSQSVVVAAWSNGADMKDQLVRYAAYTGEIQHGQDVDGAADVWELRDQSDPGALSRTSLFVGLADGTLLWLSGTEIDDVRLLYDFLVRIEDAPGSLVPKPEPGEAMPGGVTD